jgi:hypothetical protein
MGINVSISKLWIDLYYGMVKPLSIVLGKEVSQLGQARQCTLHNGQGQDHSMTLRSGVADPMIF